MTVGGCCQDVARGALSLLRQVGLATHLISAEITATVMHLYVLKESALDIRNQQTDLVP